VGEFAVDGRVGGRWGSVLLTREWKVGRVVVGIFGSGR
jgi:hypothetical protein